MRWHHKPKAKPWSRRTRSGFLWFPKTIGFETRFWEHTTWEEHFVVAVSHAMWVADKWADGDERQA